MSHPGGDLRLGGEVEVGRLGFGAMRITGPGIWGAPDEPGVARSLLRRVLEAGVNLIDTADSYGPQVSENLIAEALYPYPDDLLIATKGGFERSGPDRWEPACRPERLRHCCEESLRRLRLERIDLYQLHTVDPKVPIEDSIAALAELQAEGKIRFIGVSNVSGEQLERARSIVEIVSVQNRYNLSDRASEDVLEVCERDGLGFLPWFPLATGRLARPGGPSTRWRVLTTPRRPRSRWPGCFSARRSRCRSRGRAQSPTSRRTSKRASSSWRTTSWPASTSCRRRSVAEDQREAALERAPSCSRTGPASKRSTSADEEALDHEPLGHRLARSPRERR